MNGRTRDIAAATYFGALFAMVAVEIGMVHYAIEPKINLDTSPMSVTTPIKNPTTNSESEFRVDREVGEDERAYMDRVVRLTLEFQDRVLKGK